MLMRLMRVVCGAGAAAVAAGLALSAQQPPAQREPVQFRTRTDIVQVDVSVLDNQRRPVRGLTQADFTVLEDGRPRPVEVFTAVDLPDRPAPTQGTWTRQVPLDVVSNQAAGHEGRLVVILMDRSIPVGQPTIAARRIAAEAVESLGPWDLAAVVSTSGGVPQNLTSDRARLLRVINQGAWSAGVSAEASEVEESLAAEAGLSFPFTALADGRCQCGVCVPETITHVADALRELPRRRKLLLFVGSSITFQTADPDCGHRLRDAREAMLQALDASSLTVHSLDPRGLEVVGPVSKASSAIRGAAVPGRLQAEVGESLAARSSLMVLPDRTGGRTIINTNAPEKHIPAVFNESSSYYVLGFRPRVDGTSSRVRSIQVKVNRSGVSVHARKQYELPDRPAGASAAATDSRALPSPVAQALGGLLPASDLPLELALAAFAAPGSARAAVTIAVDVSALVRPPDALSGPPGVMELAASAYGATGHPVASARQTLGFSWPSTGPAPSRVEVLSRLDLEPGDYEIRVALSGPAGTASVFSNVAVPPFDSASLSLSNIIIVAASGVSTLPPDFLAAMLPVRPTTQRTFARGEPEIAFVRIYQGLARTEPIAPIRLRARIFDAFDRSVTDEAFVYAEREFAADRTADFRLMLPLASLPPGEYVLSLEASTANQVAGRALCFSVRSP
jgi:VWFA-related protein